MRDVESLVLPLAESQQLMEEGIILDTALVWAEFKKNCPPKLMTRKHSLSVATGRVVPAPTLSELIEQAKLVAGAIVADIGGRMELERDEWDGKVEWHALWAREKSSSEELVNIYAYALDDNDMATLFKLLRRMTREWLLEDERA